MLTALNSELRFTSSDIANRSSVEGEATVVIPRAFQRGGTYGAR